MSLDAPKQLTIDGSRFKVGIVAARFNAELVDALVEQVSGHLRASGVKKKAIFVERVPGSNELPIAAQLLQKRIKADVIIALGVLIRGGTIHYELIAESATQGLQRVALDAGVSVINGVVVAETAEQARERCKGKINRGAEFAHGALEMAQLKRKLSK